MSASPELSVLLPTDSFETVEKILACLRAQPRAGRLEIVFVAPAGAGLEDGDARVHGFAGVRVIEVADVASLPRARARALRAASAPLVLFAETHAYPNAEYLDRLVEAHAGPWPVVGPAIGNANPGSLMSWTSLLMDYGRWVEAEESGPIEDVPGHNSVYKRDLLLGLDDLDELMTADTIMQAELRARGHELYLEPAAASFGDPQTLGRDSEFCHNAQHPPGFTSRPGLVSEVGRQRVRKFLVQAHVLTRVRKPL